jgi:hypothetical protein
MVINLNTIGVTKQFKTQKENTKMKLCNLIFFSLIGVCVAGMVYANTTSEKTSQHTSTVSGTSGDLNCSGTSCVVKEK